MSLLANVPTLSYISWKNMIITYNETTYQIENSHTNRMYIYWDSNNPYILTTSNKKLDSRSGLFYLIFNESGKYTVIPNDDIEMNFSENPSRDFITSKIVGFRDETRGKFTAVQMDIDGIKFDVYDNEGKFSKFEQRVDKIDLEVKGVQKQYSTDAKLTEMREGFSASLLSLQATLGLFSSDMNTYMEDNKLTTEEKNKINAYKSSLEGKRVELNTQLDTIKTYLQSLENVDTGKITKLDTARNELNTSISNLFANIDTVCSDNVFTNTEITAVVTYFGRVNSEINECKNTIDECIFLGIDGMLIEEVSNITLKQNSIKLEVKRVENHIDTEVSKIEIEQGNIKSEVSKKVGKTEVISSINQTAESIKIQANKITLEGYVTINQGFSIDTSGNMTANNGTFNGGTIQIGYDANNYIKISGGTIYSVANGCAELIIDNGNLKLRDTNNVSVGNLGRSIWNNTNIYLTAMSAKYGSTVALSAEYYSGADFSAPLVVSSKDQQINSAYYRQGVNIVDPDIFGSIYLRSGTSSSLYHGYMGYNPYASELQICSNDTVYLGVRTPDYHYRSIEVEHNSSYANKSYIKMWAPVDLNNFPLYNASIQSAVPTAFVEPYTTNTAEGNMQTIYAPYTSTEGELRYTERVTQHTMEEYDWIEGEYKPLGVYYAYCEIPSFMQDNIEVDYHVNISKLSYGEYRIIEKNQWLFIVESMEEGFAFTYEIIAKRKDTLDTTPKSSWSVWDIERNLIDGNTEIEENGIK